jgi:hypothetical protein
MVDASAVALAVRKLRAPIGAATFGRTVEHGPERPDEVGVPAQRDLLVEELVACSPVLV